MARKALLNYWVTLGWGWRWHQGLTAKVRKSELMPQSKNQLTQSPGKSRTAYRCWFSCRARWRAEESPIHWKVKTILPSKPVLLCLFTLFILSSFCWTTYEHLNIPNCYHFPYSKHNYWIKFQKKKNSSILLELRSKDAFSSELLLAARLCRWDILGYF